MFRDEKRVRCLGFGMGDLGSILIVLVILVIAGGVLFF
jgi:hypothetical protein